MKKNVLLVSLLMLFSGLSAQDDSNLLQGGKKLMNAGSYLEASKVYRQYRTSHKLEGKQLMDVLLPESECYYMLDDYQQLDSLAIAYLECFKVSRSELGDSLNVYKAYLHKLLGNVLYPYIENNSLAENLADKHYQRGLAIFENRNSLNNVIVLHRELAQLKYKAKDYDKAYEHLETVFDYYKDRLELGINSDEPHYYSLLAQMAICNARIASLKEEDNEAKEHFAQGLSQLDKSIAYVAKKKDREYYDRIRLKGKILMMQYDRLGVNRKKEAKDCYTQYVNYQRQTVRERLSLLNESQKEQNWLALHRFLFDCYRLGSESPEMLYDLALFSKNYLLENKQTEDVRWQQVRKALTEEDCAIEFVQYNGVDDESRLGCLILKKSSKVPQFLDISSTDSILEAKMEHDVTVGDAMTSQPQNEKYYAYLKDILYSDTMLFHKIWTPELIKIIGSAKKVYFSPDGFLHQLAIEYMMPVEGKTCYRLSSTRVLTQKRKPLDSSKILVCGSMDFDTNVKPKTKGNDIAAYDYMAGHCSLNALPYTELEVHSIVENRNNPSDTLLTGKDATDENFMELLQKHYPLVHISTHGYFAGHMNTGTDLKPATSDGTMSQSGLFFAGAMTTTSDRSFDKDMFDGILSASEIAKFDMSGVEFVSLSACQTALGTITADGIFGMQRALKMAGARSLMVSLWPVGDESAYLLFKYFYSELERQEQKDIHAAWLIARQKLRETVIRKVKFNNLTLEDEVKYIKYDSPSDYNPFIMIDVF